ncbi:ATP-binding protein [Paenarthrobacter sp. NPDC089675]|uniref:ATP-binding protein n=1 Tax=Paenarthrobacter sp. NPDC089675 TaxID=3364376 RepID=UPI00380528AC
MLPDPWLDEDTVTVGLRPPAFPDRKHLLELILKAVPSPSTNGLVVVGDRGSGKSHLLLSIQAGLPDSMDVRMFAGRPELEDTRFGALGTDPEADSEHRGLPGMPGLQVLRALTRTLGPADYLYTPPSGRRRPKRHATAVRRPPLVLLVDDIHYVDPASLAVLLQLIPGFGATLVATADSRKPLPQDLYQLWEDGFLEQYLLPPFTLHEAHILCEELLQGKVQRRVSSLLAVMSGFNAGLLCLAVEDARRAGLLVERDGFWTFDVRARCDWPAVVEHVGAEHAHHPDDVREALELIALSEPLALDIVERRFGQRAVEQLLAAHHIRLLPGSPPTVRTSSWLRGEATRLAVPGSRSTALRLGIDGPALTRESAPAMLRWMTWTLDSGLPLSNEVTLSDELILSAAAAADRPSTADLALRAAAAVKDAGHLHEAKLLRARALIAEGQLKEAAPELRELTVAAAQPDVRAEAAHRLMALSLIGVVPEDVAVQGPGPGLLRSAREPAARITRHVRSAERLLLAGAAPRALEETSSAIAAVSADPALEMFRPAVLLRHVVCLRANLAWGQLEALLNCPGDYALPPHLASCLEVARGYVELSQGLPQAARLTLGPALAGLHDAGLPPVLALAAAMLAYCEAMAGNAAEAGARIAQSRSAVRNSGPESGLLAELSALFVAAAQDLAAQDLGEEDGHVFALAEEFHAADNLFLEAEAVSLLTLNASGTAVEDLVLQRRLAELGEMVEGPAGESLRTFALALLDHDPKTLESAGRSLSVNRQFAHAAVCYARAANGYEARTRSAASRRASVMMERLRKAFESGVVPPLGWLPGAAGR